MRGAFGVGVLLTILLDNARCPPRKSNLVIPTITLHFLTSRICPSPSTPRRR